MCTTGSSCASRIFALKPGLALRWMLVVKLILPSVALALAASSLQAADIIPPTSVNSHHFLIPAGNGRKLNPDSKQAPAQALDFWARDGRSWSLFWDQTLGTARFLVPLEPVLVSSPTPVAKAPVAELTRSVMDFIDAHSGLFGVHSKLLGEPYVYTLVGDWVYLFPQTTLGGIRVRGASLRVVVNGSGRLRWSKSFVARDVPEPTEPLLGREEILARVGSEAGQVISTELQIGFAGETVQSALPIWSVWVAREADEDESEIVFDARDGRALAHRRVVEYFDGKGGGDGNGEGDGAALHFHKGSVKASYPDSSDIFASPLVAKSIDQGVPHLALRNINKGLQTEALTDEDGNFSFFNTFDSMLLNASMQLAALEDDARPQLLTLAPQRQGRWVLQIGEQDTDGNFIPDRTLPSDGKSFVDFVFFPERPTPQDAREVPWWLQSYAVAARQMREADHMFRSLISNQDSMDEATFLPFTPVKIVPTDAADSQPEFLPRTRFISVIFSGIGTLSADPHDGKAAMPTLLQHEVAHHLIRIITHAITTNPPQLEGRNDKIENVLTEVVADALTAFGNNDPKIGWMTFPDGLLHPTDRGRHLGFTSDPKTRPARDTFERLRTELGPAFWTLHDLTLKDKDNPFSPPDATAMSIAMLWLGYNRVQKADERNFDNSYDLAEELALADDTPPFKGDGDLSNGVPHGAHIAKAFRDIILFDALFERGNPNQDARMDIADAIYVLGFLFQGGGPYHDCLNALDADHNGFVELTDAIRILQVLFLGGAPLDPPFGECGLDPAPPGSIENAGCREPQCIPSGALGN